jgi:hypothetical protein
MSAAPVSAVRFGVFMHGRSLHCWEWKSIELLRAAGATCLFILGSPDATPRQSSVAQALDDLVLRIAGLPPGGPANGQEPGPARYQPSTTCVVERAASGRLALGRGQTAQLSDRRLKFILFFGAGQVPEGLPGCAELGVWQFTRSAGVAEEYPFLFGLHEGADVVGFGLEQIAQSGGHHRPLLNGWFRARGERNRSVVAQVLAQAGRWPLLVLRHFLLNGALPRCVENRRSGARPPRRLALLLSLSYRELRQRLVSKLASYFVLETWNIGVVRMNFRALLAGTPLSDIALLPPLGLGRYLADPFVLSTSPQLTLLAEEYDDFAVGRIVEVAVRDPLGKPEIGVKVCLQSRHHLSYPFLFREKGVTYCLPECHQSNASLLYRYDDGKLTPVADLVPGARVTDGTVLFHGGLYWLFCGLEDDNDHVNLHLFFSKTLRGNWSAHPLNPVKTDVRSARSAGPVIVHEGALFRPAQDCSRSYGYGVSINRIDCLTVARYEETVVATIGPQAVSKSCKGLHTLSFADDLMVIDARLDAIGLKPLLVRLLRRMKRMTGGPLRAFPFWSRSA